MTNVVSELQEWVQTYCAGAGIPEQDAVDAVRAITFTDAVLDNATAEHFRTHFTAFLYGQGIPNDQRDTVVSQVAETLYAKQEAQVESPPNVGAQEETGTEVQEAESVETNDESLE